MISRAEYLYLKVRRDKLKTNIAEYKAKNQDYLSLMNIYKLGPLERETLQNAWSEHYEEVRRGYRAQCFYAVKKLVVEGQVGNLKAHINKMMEDPRWLENVPKPRLPDETYLFYKTEGFRIGVSKLAEFEKTIENYVSVYEKKSTDPYDL